MFLSVIKLGGYKKVTREHKWKSVFFALNPKSEITNATTCTRRHYEKLLYSFEQHICNLYKNQPHQRRPPVANHPSAHFYSNYSNANFSPDYAAGSSIYLSEDGKVVRSDQPLLATEKTSFSIDNILFSNGSASAIASGNTNGPFSESVASRANKSFNTSSYRTNNVVGSDKNNFAEKRDADFSSSFLMPNFNSGGIAGSENNLYGTPQNNNDMANVFQLLNIYPCANLQLPPLQQHQQLQYPNTTLPPAFTCGGIVEENMMSNINSQPPLHNNTPYHSNYSSLNELSNLNEYTAALIDNFSRTYCPSDYLQQTKSASFYDNRFVKQQNHTPSTDTGISDKLSVGGNVSAVEEFNNSKILSTYPPFYGASIVPTQQSTYPMVKNAITNPSSLNNSSIPLSFSAPRPNNTQHINPSMSHLSAKSMNSNNSQNHSPQNFDETNFNKNQ